MSVTKTTRETDLTTRGRTRLGGGGWVEERWSRSCSEGVLTVTPVGVDTTLRILEPISGTRKDRPDVHGSVRSWDGPGVPWELLTSTSFTNYPRPPRGPWSGPVRHVRLDCVGGWVGTGRSLEDGSLGTEGVERPGGGRPWDPVEKDRGEGTCQGADLSGNYSTINRVGPVRGGWVVRGTLTVPARIRSSVECPASLEVRRSGGSSLHGSRSNSLT